MNHKSIFCIALFSFVLSACASAPNGTEDSPQPSKATKSVLNYAKSDSDYLSIVSRIKSAQSQAKDYDDIIRIYALTSFYAPTSSMEQAAKLLSQNQMQNQQWQACLNTNKELLAHNYTSLTAHYGAAICATELGQVALGKFHNQVLDNFIEAIWRTGNGQSPQTPFFVTSTNDLYAFVQLHQMVATGQSLTYVNKLPVQAIEVLNPETNRSTTWYFDLRSQFRRGVIDKLEQN